MKYIEAYTSVVASLVKFLSKSQQIKLNSEKFHVEFSQIMTYVVQTIESAPKSQPFLSKTLAKNVQHVTPYTKNRLEKFILKPTSFKI